MKLVLKILPNTNPEKTTIVQIEIDGNYKGLILVNDTDTLDLLDDLLKDGMCMVSNNETFKNPYSDEEYSYELTSLLREKEKEDG